MKKIEDAYEGRVVNGRVEWRGGKPPPDGARFKVRMNSKSKAPAPRTGKGSGVRKSARQAPHSRPKVDKDLEKLYQNLLSIAGTAKNWPSDMADQHDHYLHGTRRK